MPKGNDVLVLYCKLLTYLAHCYYAFNEYSVIHIIFFTFSYSKRKEYKWQ